MTEREAAAIGPLLVSKRPMTRVAPSVENDETHRFMKVVADPGSGRILGAAILGASGDEAIHGLLDMTNVGATADQLRRTVPIHPTVSELIPALLSALRRV